LVTPADCREIYDVILELYLKIFSFKKKLKYAGVQVSMRKCRHSSMQICKFGGMQAGKYLGLQACRHSDMQACRPTRIYLFV
jgi:hypothetical protein